MPQVAKTALLPYSDQQMFDLVANVDEYPRFLPWCGGVSVRDRSEQGLTATVMIAFKGVRQSFTTRNVHEEPRRIAMHLVDGPFKALEGGWVFRALNEHSCKIEFTLDYTLSSGLLAGLLSPAFDYIARSMVDAFVSRAEEVYGE